MARKRYVSGLETVHRVLGKMTDAQAEALTDALNRSAAEIAQVASILAVRSDDDLHVADQINHRIVERRDGRAVTAVIWAGDVPETQEAAFRMEFGRQPGGEGMEGHPGHGEQPFFFVAVSARRKRTRARVRRQSRKAARELVRAERQAGSSR